MSMDLENLSDESLGVVRDVLSGFIDEKQQALAEVYMEQLCRAVLKVYPDAVQMDVSPIRPPLDLGDPLSAERGVMTVTKGEWDDLMKRTLEVREDLDGLLPSSWQPEWLLLRERALVVVKGRHVASQKGYWPAGAVERMERKVRQT